MTTQETLTANAGEADPLKRCALGNNRSDQSPILRRLITPIDAALERENRQYPQTEVGAQGAPGSAAVIDAGELQVAKAAIEDIVASIVDSWRVPVRRLARAEARRQAKLLRGFRTRLNTIWGETLRQMEDFEMLSFEVGAELCAIPPEPSTQTPILREVLLGLHARACKVFGEIRVLLEHGYADGAHARWRTLHETAVVANFLREYGERGASLYIEHEAVEAYRGATEYQRHHAELGYDPVDPATLEELQLQVKSLLSEHGPRFGTQYGWAAVLLGHSRPGIEDLERAVHLDRLRPFYRMASHHVHANPKAFTFSLSQPDWLSQVRLAGPANSGLADPAHGAALSLNHVNVALLADVATLDSLALLKVFDELVREIGESAFDAHSRLESLIEAERIESLLSASATES